MSITAHSLLCMTALIMKHKTFHFFTQQRAGGSYWQKTRETENKIEWVHFANKVDELRDNMVAASRRAIGLPTAINFRVSSSWLGKLHCTTKLRSITLWWSYTMKHFQVICLSTAGSSTILLIKSFSPSLLSLAPGRTTSTLERLFLLWIEAFLHHERGLKMSTDL